MRNDAVGFFWDDTPPPRAPKAEQVKRTPPEAKWLLPDYLPGLEEARRFPVHLMTLQELAHAAHAKEEMILDVEVYPNYFLACFTSLVTGKVTFVEMYEGEPLDIQKLRWLIDTFTTTGFNSLSYDLAMCALALAGCTTQQIKEASDQIIVMEFRSSDVLRARKVKWPKCDHMDLIEVAPLRASLKTYAGRLHCRKMQDLPFHPSVELSPAQRDIVRWYCVNDITNTTDLRECLREHIDLRYTLSNEYGVDLRSKSDAQIAEAVISAELTRRTGRRPTKPTIEVGTTYRYRVPAFLQFRSPLMQWALDVVRNADFVVDYTGSVAMPEQIKALKLEISGSVYRMGIGGLHSSESTVAHHTDRDYVLRDFDVTSYYPYIILNQALFPQHLGPVFLDVYRAIVERRVRAKERGDKVVADSLKIVVNGSFGKLGSKYSILYAPDLLFQTTITGQLALLMLIERLEMSGIRVVSANTDGIVVKCPRAAMEWCDSIVAGWERDTRFNTEETRYCALYSRDVNNYFAVKQGFDKATKTWIERPDGTKNKGAYANPWASTKNLGERLHKNPTATLCVEAAEAFLTKGTPVDHTVRSCTDVTKLVAVRSVKGGAVKVWERVPPTHESREELLDRAGYVRFAEGAWVEKGSYDTHGKSAVTTDKAYATALDRLSTPGETDYLGKTVRWYYAKDLPGEIVYASSGNKVPRSEGARPLMELPDHMPADVDFDWYTEEALRILRDVAALPPLA